MSRIKTLGPIEDPKPTLMQKVKSFLKTVSILLTGFAFAFVCFVIYYLAVNLDMVMKLKNAEEMRAMYKSCKVEKVYIRK